MCGYTKQTAPYRTGTQTATFSRLICVSEHLRPSLSDLIQKKLHNEKTHKISNRLLKEAMKKASLAGSWKRERTR